MHCVLYCALRLQLVANDFNSYALPNSTARVGMTSCQLAVDCCAPEAPQLFDAISGYAGWVLTSAPRHPHNLDQDRGNFDSMPTCLPATSLWMLICWPPKQ